MGNDFRTEYRIFYKDLGMAFIHSQAKVGLFLLDTVHRYFWCIIKKIRKYTLYFQTVSELNALNLRELFDLGLSRLMVRNVA